MIIANEVHSVAIIACPTHTCGIIVDYIKINSLTNLNKSNPQYVTLMYLSTRLVNKNNMAAGNH